MHQQQTQRHVILKNLLITIKFKLKNRKPIKNNSQNKSTSWQKNKQ